MFLFQPVQNADGVIRKDFPFLLQLPSQLKGIEQIAQSYQLSNGERDAFAHALSVRRHRGYRTWGRGRSGDQVALLLPALRNVR